MIGKSLFYKIYKIYKTYKTYNLITLILFAQLQHTLYR